MLANAPSELSEAKKLEQSLENVLAFLTKTDFSQYKTDEERYKAFNDQFSENEKYPTIAKEEFILLLEIKRKLLSAPNNLETQDPNGVSNPRLAFNILASIFLMRMTGPEEFISTKELHRLYTYIFNNISNRPLLYSILTDIATFSFSWYYPNYSPAGLIKYFADNCLGEEYASAIYLLPVAKVLLETKGPALFSAYAKKLNSGINSFREKFSPQVTVSTEPTLPAIRKNLVDHDFGKLNTLRNTFIEQSKKLDEIEQKLNKIKSDIKDLKEISEDEFKSYKNEVKLMKDSITNYAIHSDYFSLKSTECVENPERCNKFRSKFEIDLKEKREKTRTHLYEVLSEIKDKVKPHQRSQSTLTLA